MRGTIARVMAEQAAAGEIVFPPATEAAIAAARDALRSRFGAVLPPEYGAFLRCCNGLDFDGMVLHGVPHDIVAANAGWREGPGHDGYLILGTTDMDLLTVAPGGTGAVLRDRISGEAVTRFDGVAQALEAMLEWRLAR